MNDGYWAIILGAAGVAVGVYALIELAWYIRRKTRVDDDHRIDWDNRPDGWRH